MRRQVRLGHFPLLREERMRALVVAMHHHHAGVHAAPLRPALGIRRGTSAGLEVTTTAAATTVPNMN